MRKIPTLFQRDPNNMKHVLPVVNPDCEWVLAGEGTATAKIDGTCVKLAYSGEWWARREIKKDAPTPENFVAVQHDPVTMKTVGWEPAEQSSFAKFLREAQVNALRDGVFLRTGTTFELCGPKINKNPLRLPEHRVIVHGSTILTAPISFEELRDFLTAPDFGYEGIVWWRDPGNPDCDKAKLKSRDFPAQS